MIRKITIFFLGLLLLVPAHSLAASNANISIDMHYLVVSPAEDGSTNMMNMVNYTNTSAQEYKGDGTGEAVLKVTLPKGASNLNFLDNKIAIKQSPTGFITTDPFPANQTMVLPYSYRVPKGKDINLKFDYPVQLLQVLVPEGMGSVEFKGVQFTNQGQFKFEDQKYVGYSVEGINADQSFTMRYNKSIQPSADSLKPAKKSDSSKSAVVSRTAPPFHNPGHLRMWAESPLHQFNPHIVLILLLAIIIAGIYSYAYFRRKDRLEAERLGADKEEQAFKNLMAKQKAILDKILELEEIHENGEMQEDEYAAKLQAYKQHLIQVKLNLRKFVE
ncbi:MAG: hypothetical protein Q8898_00680 [Bacillota bacterium]|nr:hypothetical protein [Bacillota bacterium]